MVQMQRRLAADRSAFKAGKVPLGHIWAWRECLLMGPLSVTRVPFLSRAVVQDQALLIEE